MVLLDSVLSDAITQEFSNAVFNQLEGQPAVFEATRETLRAMASLSMISTMKGRDSKHRSRSTRPVFA